MLDVIAKKFSGALSERDIRVVWTDGVLYVCKTPTSIWALDCPVMPVRRSGYYQARIGEKISTFVLPGCGTCRERVRASPVGQMSVEDIVATVSVDA